VKLAKLKQTPLCHRRLYNTLGLRLKASELRIQASQGSGKRIHTIPALISSVFLELVLPIATGAGHSADTSQGEKF
jgi:hypothetical protein